MKRKRKEKEEGIKKAKMIKERERGRGRASDSEKNKKEREKTRREPRGKAPGATHVVEPVDAVEGRVGLHVALEVHVVAFLDEPRGQRAAQAQAHHGGVWGGGGRHVRIPVEPRLPLGGAGCGGVTG